MSKKTQPKHSNAGKGDKNRITNHKKYADNWEKIFGKKGEKNEKTSIGWTYLIALLSPWTKKRNKMLPIFTFINRADVNDL